MIPITNTIMAIHNNAADNATMVIWNYYYPSALLCKDNII